MFSLAQNLSFYGKNSFTGDCCRLLCCQKDAVFMMFTGLFYCSSWCWWHTSTCLLEKLLKWQHSTWMCDETHSLHVFPALFLNIPKPELPSRRHCRTPYRLQPTVIPQAQDCLTERQLVLLTSDLSMNFVMNESDERNRFWSINTWMGVLQFLHSRTWKHWLTDSWSALLKLCWFRARLLPLLHAAPTDTKTLNGCCSI